MKDPVSMSSRPLGLFGELLLSSDAVGLVGIDSTGRIRLSGSGANLLFACAEGELIGQSIEELLPGFTVDQLRRSQRVMEIGQWRPEWLIDRQRGDALRLNGTRSAVQISVAGIIDSGDICYVVLLVDLTAQLEHGDKLTRLAYSDTVTDLPNRAHFMRRLREASDGASQRGAGIALLFIDIDRFKEINDTMGHSGGDQALEILGQRLTSAVRPQDIVARYGGDEFVVLMEEPGEPEVAEEIAERVAERILLALQKPVRLADRGIRLSVSIGIAIATESRETPESLLDSADAAMYSVKVRGGGAFAHAAISKPPPVQSGRHAG